MLQKFSAAIIGAVIAAVLFSLCSRGTPENKDALVYVGRTPLTQQDADAFRFVSLHIPGRQDTFWLGRNGQVWSLIAVEAVYQKIKGNKEFKKMRSSRAWQWKERIYLSGAFEKQILQGNCGYSDDEVRKYYDTHRNDFRTITYSENMKPCTTDVVPPFDSVRANVARELFLSNYKHDSGTMNLNDPRLFARFRERMYRDYFLEEYFKEKYDRPLPDSIMKLYDSSSVIDTEDVDAVLSMMSPEDRKEHEKSLVFIIRRMTQWKLFSDKAESSGYSSRPEVGAVLKWAWKNEVVSKYVSEVMVPKLEKVVVIDPDMSLFSFWDEIGIPAPVIDSVKLKAHRERLLTKKRGILFDGLIYEIRSKAGVRFQDPDVWSDGRVRKPARLLREADAFRDSGNTLQAQTLYGVLSDYYPFTEEGREALFEHARIQAEQEQGPLEAVKNLRRFLMLDGNSGRRCEAMYRIAFIYDQYLNKKELAGANYRWVVENAPGCAFAGDAKVMLRHLGETLPDAETLRAEAKGE